MWSWDVQLSFSGIHAPGATVVDHRRYKCGTKAGLYFDSLLAATSGLLL